MAGVASLGGRAAYIGRVRDDELGRIFTHDIRAAGVDFGTPPAADGPRHGALPDHGHARRPAHDVHLPRRERGAGARGRRRSTWWRSADVTYLEGYLWDPPRAKEAFRIAMAAAHGAGRRVSFTLSDPFCVERHREEFLALVDDEVDVLFANQHEIEALYEVGDIAAAVAAVRGRCEIAVITRSELGSLVVTADAVHEVPAAPVAHVVDTTGRRRPVRGRLPVRAHPRAAAARVRAHRGDRRRRGHLPLRSPPRGAPRRPCSGPSPAPRGAMVGSGPMPIADSITDLIGRTPLVRLGRIAEGSGAQMVAKLESFNPAGSRQGPHRPGDDRGRRGATGRLVPGDERHRRADLRQHRHRAGLRVRRPRATACILTMPETMSVERRTLLRAFGAELVLTPGAEGMRGAIARAEEIAARPPRARSCPSSSRTRPTPRSTAARPPRRSGPTPTARSTSSSRAWAPAARSPASAEVLAERRPGFRAVAVEPADSPVLSGGAPGPAQDPGHRRRLRARGPEHRGLRRGHHLHRRRRLRHVAPAGARGGHPRAASPRARTSGRPSRWPGGQRAPAS